MRKLRKIDHLEILADIVKEVLNEHHIDIRCDYDDDQTEKIEIGRKIANRYVDM